VTRGPHRKFKDQNNVNGRGQACLLHNSFMPKSKSPIFDFAQGRLCPDEETSGQGWGARSIPQDTADECVRHYVVRFLLRLFLEGQR
jgi:hypothetical protein